MFRDTIIFIVAFLILCNQVFTLKYLHDGRQAHENNQNTQHKSSAYWKRELMHGSQVIPSDFVRKDSQPSKKVDIKGQINPDLKNKNRGQFQSEKLSDYININDNKQPTINIGIKINISIEKQKNKLLNNKTSSEVLQGKRQVNEKSLNKKDNSLSSSNLATVKQTDNGSIIEQKKQVTSLPTPLKNLTEKSKNCLDKCVNKGGISCKYWGQQGGITCCHPAGCQFPINCEQDKLILIDDCQNRK